MNTVPRRRAAPTGRPTGAKTKMDENTAPIKPLATTRSQAAATPVDPYSEEMEKKHNVEGSNYQEIVFLRQENDAVQARVAELEALNRQLQQQAKDASKLRVPADVTNTTNGDGANAAADQEYLSDALAKERAENAELRRQLEQAHMRRESAVDDPPEMIPRPRGSAGNNFNIEEEMGLGGSAADHAQYKALQRNLRDLMLQARINWEVPWSEVPASSKGQLFAVARERHPYLAQFTNDWATEEIVKQYIKNKCRHAYKNGWLNPPTKFEYLKANSAKRDPSAPRKKSKKFDTASLKKAAKTAKKAADRKVSSSKKADLKGKGKAKNVMKESEDEQGSDRCDSD